MTDIVTSQKIDLSSWDTLYNIRNIHIFVAVYLVWFWFKWVTIWLGRLLGVHSYLFCLLLRICSSYVLTITRNFAMIVTRSMSPCTGNTVFYWEFWRFLRRQCVPSLAGFCRYLSSNRSLWSDTPRSRNCSYVWGTRWKCLPTRNVLEGLQ
jgi:hypothetical protein